MDPITILRENYEKAEPIFLEDAAAYGIELPTLESLTDNGALCRFDAETFFLPRRPCDVISPDTVAFHKYLCRRGKNIGFYSGHSLANRLGILLQVYIVDEITTNLCTAKREERIDGKKFILRPPVVPVTDENVHLLELLDALSNLEETAEEDPDTCKFFLSTFAKRCHITEEDLKPLLSYYSKEAAENIKEIGGEYVFTRE